MTACFQDAYMVKINLFVSSVLSDVVGYFIYYYFFVLFLFLFFVCVFCFVVASGCCC